MHRFINPAAAVAIQNIKKLMTSLKLVISTLLREGALILTLTLTLNPNFLHSCTSSAPFATRNNRTANDVSRSRMSVMSDVLNASSDR